MRTLGSQPIGVADIRLTSDTFSSSAVSLTPRPSSRAARMRCTWNGVFSACPGAYRMTVRDTVQPSPSHGSSLAL